MSEHTQQETTQQNIDQENIDWENFDQVNNEMLSAFIDGEQSEMETSRIIDALLNDPNYKKQYIRTQLINDHLHEQAQADLLSGDLRKNIALALDELPAHYSDDAVSLQTLTTEDVSRSGWFQTFIQKSLDNRMLTGLSVAASVMLVTLFTLQNFNNNLDAGANTQLSRSNNLNDNALVSSVQSPSFSSQSVSPPSLIQSPSALPAYLVSTEQPSAAPGSANTKQRYQWIEADPELSRQVREYINGHEQRRSAYDLQPKIRTATYQISE